MGDEAAIGAYTKRMPDKAPSAQVDGVALEQVDAGSNTAWQMQTEAPESPDGPASVLELAMNGFAIDPATECDGADDSGTASGAPPAWATWGPMSDVADALAGGGEHPDGQMYALTMHYAGFGGAPPARQAEVIAAVSEQTSPEVALRFAEWLATNPMHPYDRRRTLDRAPLGHRGATVFGSLAVAATPDLVKSGLETAMGGSDRGHAFMDGFLEQARAQLPPETLEAVLDKLSDGALVNTVFPPIFAAGALHGAAAELGNLLQMVVSLPDVIAGVQALLGAVLGPDGAVAAHALGSDLAASIGGDLASVATMDLTSVCYWMGKKAGPLLADLLLGLVTGGAAILARRSLDVVAALLEGVDAIGKLRRGWTAMATHLDVNVGGPLMADGPGAIRDPSSGPTGGPRDPAHVDALYGRDGVDGPGRSEGTGPSADGRGRRLSLTALIGREVTPDNFVEMRLLFRREGYHLSMDSDGFMSIRRQNGGQSDGLPKLFYDVETGLIQEGVEGSNRLSTSGALRRSLAREAGRDVLPDHVAHHLVPDEVVRKHPLFEAARRRGDPPYDLDSASNGAELRRTPDIDGDSSLPTHSGSHPQWNVLARDYADDAMDILMEHHGDLASVPPDQLTRAARSVETLLREDLSDAAQWSDFGRLR